MSSFSLKAQKREFRGRITIYSIHKCPSCSRAKDVLAKQSLPYVEINVEEHIDERTPMIELTGRSTVPQIFFNAIHIGGCDDLIRAVEEQYIQKFIDVVEQEELDVKDPRLPVLPPSLPHENTDIAILSSVLQDVTTRPHRFRMKKYNRTVNVDDFVDYLTVRKIFPSPEKALQWGKRMIHERRLLSLASKKDMLDSSTYLAFPKHTLESVAERTSKATSEGMPSSSSETAPADIDDAQTVETVETDAGDDDVVASQSVDGEDPETGGTYVQQVSYLDDRRDPTFRNVVNMIAVLMLGYIFHVSAGQIERFNRVVNWKPLTSLVEGMTDMLTIWLLCTGASFIAHVVVSLSPWIPKRIATAVMLCCCMALISVPYAIQQRMESWSFLMRSSFTLHCVVLTCKCWSYFVGSQKIPANIAGNIELERESACCSRKGHVSTIGFLRFLLYPTLTFEIPFALSPKRNYQALGKEILSFIFLCFVGYLMIEESLVPIIRSSLQMHFISALLQLMLPAMVVWLIIWYATMHNLMNVLAELMQYGDREFYQDWWNAESILDMISRMNRISHRFVQCHVQHVLVEMVGPKYTPFITAALVIGVVEYVLAASTCFLFRPIIATMFAMQGPVLYLVERSNIRGSRTGNTIMWLSILVGIPSLSTLYARERMFYIAMMAVGMPQDYTPL